ncbi:MAG: 23S rRNA (adenine(2503)-C(2))-methyltransferase RlmN [Planctomycetota bacterium]|nr:MAG: 23S rRNA (adenine(2503)-C(2))-methyltransferase RlmN [Planctomycetota bacterium]
MDLEERKKLCRLPFFYDTSLDDLANFWQSWGWPKFQFKELLRWAYQREWRDFTEFTTLSKEQRQVLKEHFFQSSLEVLNVFEADDGTKKILYRLEDGQKIETVLIPEGKRLTVCISTQVGCPIRCRFCASGLEGMRRNLSVAEIVEQVIFARKFASGRITNIVVMGMGEPFLNLDNVLAAISLFHHPWTMGIGLRKITLSTVGLRRFMPKILKGPLYPRLAISLHSARDEVRKTLIPYPQLMSVEEIAEFIPQYLNQANSRLTLEYVMLEGVNTSIADAKELVKRFAHLQVRLNLIPWNSVKGMPWSTPSKETVERFVRILSQSSLTVTVRKRQGDSIAAACGQLRLLHD